MAIPITKRPEKAADQRCADCGHLESEHGKTGTRPCLAVVGSITDRGFCACDHFRTGVTKAA